MKKILILLLLFIMVPSVYAKTIPTTVRANPSINTGSQTKQDLKVLVIVIDPILSSITNTSLYPNNNGHPRVSEWFGFSTTQRINDLKKDINESSHGYINVQIVKIETLNEFPKYTFQLNLKNGTKAYRYDEATYIEMGKCPNTSSLDSGCWGDMIRNNWFKQGGDSAGVFDYDYLINKYNLITRRNNREFDQVWIFNTSPIGTYETAMVGRNAYWVNGIVDKTYNCDNFVIAGFETARPDGMFHSYGHMTEQIMKRIYGQSVDIYEQNVYNVNSKEAYLKLNLWEQFTLTAYNNSNSNYTGVGGTHFPYYATQNYGYAYEGTSKSNWRTWVNSPTGSADSFVTSTRSDFFNSDINKEVVKTDPYNYDRLYQRFWFSLIPHVTGYTTDGYSNNWWKYIYSLDYAVEVYNNYGTTTINAFKGDIVEADYVIYYYSGNADRLQTINEGSNVVISNKSALTYNNGKLYGNAAGSSTVKVSYDGKSITYTVNVKEPKTKKYALNTTANNLGISVGSGSTIKVYNNNATVRKTNEKLATSDRIYVYTNGKKSDLYNVIVTGDVTGSGSISVSDVAKLYQYLKGKITMDDIYVQAGNVVSSDSTIKINDVAKLYQFVKGKISSL